MQIVSSVDLICLNTFASSANIAMRLFFTGSGKYNRNKVGPRMDPWGTPEVIGKDSDIAPSTVTL